MKKLLLTAAVALLVSTAFGQNGTNPVAATVNVQYTFSTNQTVTLTKLWRPVFNEQMAVWQAGTNSVPGYATNNTPPVLFGPYWQAYFKTMSRDTVVTLERERAYKAELEYKAAAEAVSSDLPDAWPNMTPAERAEIQAIVDRRKSGS